MNMQRFRIYWTIVLVALTSPILFAQEKIERNITIEKNYEPAVEDAGKITAIPEVTRVDNTKAKVDYTEIYQPIPLEKQIVTLSEQAVSHSAVPKSKEAFIRLGAGNYWNTLGEIALPVINTEKDRLDLRVNHLATFGKKQHAFSKANLAYNHFFADYDLYANVGVSNRYFNYYGDNFKGISGDSFDLTGYADSLPLPNYLALSDSTTISLFDIANNPLHNLLWKYHAQVGFQSLPTVIGTQHQAALNYEFFDSADDLKETIAKASYGFERELGSHRLGVNVDFTNIFYHALDTTQTDFHPYYAVFSFNPYYLMEGNDWYLRAGLKTDFSFVHGRVFNPMPDISGEWRVAPKWFAIYAGVVGSLKIADLNTIYTENPYIFRDVRIKDVYTPVNPYFGFKLKPVSNFLVDAYVDYRYIIDDYFFVNKAYEASPMNQGAFNQLFTNRFDVVYSNASLLKSGIRMYYNIKDIVNLELKGAYNFWNVATEDHAWMKPAIEAEFMTDVRINKKLRTSAMVFYEGERFAKLDNNSLKMKPKLDINLGASYAFNQTFSAFAKLNNLLNSKYQQFYGYEVQGINFMLGGAVSF